MQKTKIYGVIACVVAFLALMMLPKCAEDVKNEEIVINQVPFTGELEYWTTPGFKFQKGGRTSNYYKTNQIWFNEIEKEKKVSEKDAFFFCYAARLLSIFIFKTSLFFSIISLREVILQK